MISEWSVTARYGIERLGLDIYIYGVEREDDGRVKALFLQVDPKTKECAFVWDESGASIQPTFTMAWATGAPQRMMDAMWQAGVRPSDLNMVDGERAAMKANLTDLREVLGWAIGREIAKDADKNR